MDKLTNFNTVDSNYDSEEYDYCINSNFESMYKKINELIIELNKFKNNEMKEECK